MPQRSLQLLAQAAAFIWGHQGQQPQVPVDTLNVCTIYPRLSKVDTKFRTTGTDVITYRQSKDTATTASLESITSARSVSQLGPPAVAYCTDQRMST